MGGSNKAVDDVVDNVALRFSASREQPGVYRLYTEVIEAGSMPGTEEAQGPSASTPPYDTLKTVFSHL